MNQHETRPKVGPAPDDALIQHRIELVEKHFQRPQPMTAGPLHQAVNQHRRGSVGEQGLHHAPGGGVLIAPLRFASHIIADCFEKTGHGLTNWMEGY